MTKFFFFFLSFVGQREHEQVNEEERVKFASFTKQGKTNMLNYNNQIASLQKSLEMSTAGAAEAAGSLEESIRKASAETLEVGQVLMAVKNLLQRCTSKQHGENLKHTDISNVDEGSSGGHGDHGHKGDEPGAAALHVKGERAKKDLNVIAGEFLNFCFGYHQIFILVNLTYINLFMDSYFFFFFFKHNLQPM